MNKLHRELPDELNGPCRNTLAPSFILKVDGNSELINKDLQEHHHGVTTKILWTGQRFIPDLQLATGFHCARIKLPDS